MSPYKVKAGDTLSAIAAQHRVPESLILRANPIIQDRHYIETGWTLQIPDPPPAEGKPPLPPPMDADDFSTDEVYRYACQLEFVALLHVTGEAQTVYALTQTQLNAIESEIAGLQAPLRDLQGIDAGAPADIPAGREAVWQHLKDLRALPAPKQSTTAEDLLNDYDAKWKYAEKRLAHQKRRQERIRFEINQIDALILRPLSQQAQLSTRRQLSLAVFATLYNELRETLPAVENTVQAHAAAARERQAAADSMDQRLRKLRAALEAEITYRVAQGAPQTPPSQREQLKIESQRLRAATGWPDYIAEAAIKTLTQRQQKLDALDEERTPVWDALGRLATQTSPAHWIIDLLDGNDPKPESTAQQQYSRLFAEQQAMLDSLTRTSPPLAVGVVAKPQTGAMPARPIVELKHTGAGGYRYVRREVLDQLRGGWRPLTMAEVKAAMNTGDLKRAVGSARQGLNAPPSLTARLARWKTQDDNFFNQLNVELVKAQAATKDGRFAADAEAQMFRFAAQAGLAATYDPAKQEAYIGGKVDGQYSLLQGQAALSARLPSEDGQALILSYEDAKGSRKALHCGKVRAEAEYKIQGFAGACASLAARASVSSAPGNVGINGETNGEAFAGASLSNEARFAMQWKAAYEAVMGDQGQVSEAQANADKAFKSLLDVKPEAAISAGIGVGFEFKVALSEGKLALYLKGNLVIGVGGGGGVAAELNGSQIWELVNFIRWSLEQSDFRFMDWIEKEAFEHISFLLKAFAVSDDDFQRIIQRRVDDVVAFWEDLTTANTKVRDTAEKVIQNNSLSMLTPSAKAALLHVVVQDSTPVFGTRDPYREVGAEAAMKILETIDNHREFIEVLKRMGNDGRKGGFDDLRRNYSALMPQRLFRSQQASRVEEWLRRLYS